MAKPIILINFKTYKQVEDKAAVKLAKVCEKVAKETKTNIAVAVSALDIKDVAKAVSIPVFAQHVDAVEFGAHTGWIVPEELKHLGVKGTLLNHAEHPLPFKEIEARVKMCKKLGLKICICASTPAMCEKVAKLKPDYVAYEPPALIGGDISVATAQPVVLEKVAKPFARRKTEVLCGAGVKTQEDVRVSLDRGMRGVLLASGITKAAQPRKVLLDLIAGLKKK